MHNKLFNKLSFITEQCNQFELKRKKLMNSSERRKLTISKKLDLIVYKMYTSFCVILQFR